MNTNLKALILIGMGLFLYSRFAGGTLFFYINERFMWLTFLAALGFIILGIGYKKGQGEPHHHDHHHDHEHEHHHGQLTWPGGLIVLLPVILGLLVAPRPLGSTALSNRDIRTESLTSISVSPGAQESNTLSAKPPLDRNILDWLIAFRSKSAVDELAGEPVQVTGFVYRDERFGDDMFMTSCFIVSCCVADAAPIGLITRWPDAPTLETDQWVEVKGHFEAGTFDGRTMPILIVETITETDIPEQPYLYP